jgi:hypothetical protein
MDVGYVVGTSWEPIGATKEESDAIIKYGWSVANAPRPLDYGGRGPGGDWFIGFTWHSPNGGIDAETARHIPSGAWGYFAAANAHDWMTDGYGGSVFLLRSWEMDKATELRLLDREEFTDLVWRKYAANYAADCGAWDKRSRSTVK